MQPQPPPSSPHSRTRALGRLSVAWLLAAVSSCGLCLRGSGNVVHEERTIGAFHTLEIDGSADVVAVPAGSIEGGDLRITTDDNLMEHVTTRVKNGRLVIDTGDNVCLSPSGPLTVFATLDGLRSVSIDGSGDVKCEYLIEGDELRVDIDGSGSVSLGAVRFDRIEASIDGSGNVELSGSTQRLEVSIDGSGDVDAFGLAAEDGKVDIDGSGDVGLVVTGHLDVDIDGSGDVTYHGKPGKLTTRVEGSGDVRSR